MNGSIKYIAKAGYFHHLGVDPTINKHERAMRLCRLQYSIAEASIRPPMNIMLVSFSTVNYWPVFDMNISTYTFIYAMHTSPVSIIPSKGKNTTGIKLVIANGSASVIQ